MAKIVLIVGSVRRDRNGIKVARWMENKLKELQSEEGVPCSDKGTKLSCEQEISWIPRRDSLSGDMYHPRRCRWKLPVGPCEDMPEEYKERATFQREAPGVGRATNGVHQHYK